MEGHKIWEVLSPIDVSIFIRSGSSDSEKRMELTTRAAEAGGVQAVISMPTKGRDETNFGDAIGKARRAAKVSRVDFGAYANLPPSCRQLDRLSREIPDAAGLVVDNGKNIGDMSKWTQTNRDEIDHWIKKSKERGLHSPIIVRAMGAVGFQLAEYVARQEHFVHWSGLSTEEEVELAGRLQAEHNEFFTSGVSINHLILTDEDVDRYGWTARVSPELGSARDRTALRTALAEGTIAILQSDDSRLSLRDKVFAENGKTDPKSADSERYRGLGSIEFMLPLAIGMVQSGKLSRSRLIDAMYHQPKRMLGLPEDSMQRKTEVEIAPHITEPFEVFGDAPSPYVGWRMAASIIGFTDEKERIDIISAQSRQTP